MLESLTYPGLWRLARKHYKEGLKEIHRSLSKKAFVKSLQQLIPEIRAQDLVPAPAGVRAQALLPSGGLVDDFLTLRGPDSLHVCNAPSPAATASLEIGKAVAEQVPEMRTAVTYMMQPSPGYHCRFCNEPLRETFVDLGMSPLCESYIDVTQLSAPESFYPLHCFVCERCFLVQLPEHVGAGEIFEEYAYFSSYSDSWLAHASRYVEEISSRLGLGPNSSVMEVASNDGYLLQYFKAKGIPVLGIEPARNVAQVAIKKGIPTITSFFGQRLARELASGGKQADLLLGNNVLAHVPDINDFVAGLKLLLKPQGVITMEFPHLVRLVEEKQFDTIYHEHFSYLSFTTVEQIFASSWSGPLRCGGTGNSRRIASHLRLS